MAGVYGDHPARRFPGSAPQLRNPHRLHRKPRPWALSGETIEHAYAFQGASPEPGGTEPSSQASSTRDPSRAQRPTRDPTLMSVGSWRRPDGRARLRSVLRIDVEAGSDSSALSRTTRATPKSIPRASKPEAKKALSISTPTAPVSRLSIDLSAGSPTTRSTETRGPRATGSPALERIASRSSASGTATRVPETSSRGSAITTVPGSRSGARAPAKPPRRAASMGMFASAATQREAAFGPTPVSILASVGPRSVERVSGEFMDMVQPGTRTRATSKGMA